MLNCYNHLLIVFQSGDVQAAQIITANGQTYSVLPQAQMQTVTIDGQEAIYIPASFQHAAAAAAATPQTIQLGANQTILTPSGQLIRTAPNVLQNVQGMTSSTNQVRTFCVLI